MQITKVCLHGDIMVKGSPLVVYARITYFYLLYLTHLYLGDGSRRRRRIRARPWTSCKMVAESRNSRDSACVVVSCPAFRLQRDSSRYARLPDWRVRPALARLHYARWAAAFLRPLLLLYPWSLRGDDLEDFMVVVGVGWMIQFVKIDDGGSDWMIFMDL